MYNFYQDSKCCFCGITTSHWCDECRRDICTRDHTAKVKIGSNTYLELCPECAKKLKPGAVLGGVRITPEML